MTAITLTVSGLLGVALPSFADSNQLITYQGRILRPDGTPLEGTIDFSIKIYSPGPSKCLLWAERQTLPMHGSMGAFSLEIGKDLNRLTGAAGGGATSFGQVFVNHPNLTINSTQCNTGYNSYTANFADDRTLSVTFSDAGQEIRVVDLPVKSVPFAMQAEQISGYSVNYLFKIGGPGQPGDKPSSLFAKDAVDLLWEIAHNQDLQGQRLKNVGAPTVGTDAATKDYVDTAISSQGSLAVTDVTGDANILVGTVGSARALSLGTTGVAAGTYGAVAPTGVSVPVITVDMWGRITTATEEPIPFATTGGGFGLITVDPSTGLTLNGGTLGLNLTDLSGANFGPQAANVVFAGPASGGTGAVTFRGLVEDDIPVLAATGKVENSATTATPALVNDAIVARDATGGFTASAAFLNYLALDNGLQAGTSSAILLSAPMGASYSLVFPGTAPNPGDVLSFDGLGNMVWAAPGSMGMTGLELIVPSGEMSVSAPVGPGDGTLTISWVDQNARLVFAAPVAGSGQPSFRALDPLDIPDLDADKIVSGTFDVARIPDLDAAKITTGTLGVERGGTGLDGSVATTGQLLIGTGTGGFALGHLFGGSGVIIDNQSGSVGISFNPSTAGVVTHVGAEVPSFMTVAPSGISSSGTFQFSYNSQAQNLVFAAPTGASGAPDFRLLEASDIPDLDAAKIVSGTLDVARIPDLDASKITSGTLGVERGGTGLVPDVADANRLYGINAAGDNSEFKTVVAGSGVVIDHSAGSISFSFDPVAGGVVTNVGLEAPTSVFSVSGSAVTGAGTLGLHLNPQSALSVLAAPTGSTGEPAFRALTPYDIPYLDTSHLITGILPVERGGTGLDGSFAADGQLLIGNGTGGFSLNTLTALSGVVIQNAAGSIAIGFDPVAGGVVTNVGLEAPTSVFTVSGSAVTGAGTLGLSLNAQTAAHVFAAPTGSTGTPEFRLLEASDIPDLDASKITSGILDTDRGGTGLDASAAANGQLLIGDGSGLSLGYLIGGSGVVITNDAGSIGIAFDPLAGGVVTNVGATVPSYMSVAPSSISSAGTFAFDFNVQDQNFVFAAPTGASGAPGFRLLEASDIPDLDAAKIVSGTLDVARIPDLDAAKITSGTLLVERGGTGLDGSTAAPGQLLIGTGTGFELNTLTAESGVIITNAAGSISIGFNPSSAGVVTNVGLEAPTSVFTVSGSAVTGAGTLGLSFLAQDVATVFAAPTGASGLPSFRSLIASDITAGTFDVALIPDLDASKIVSGTLDVARIPDLDASKITSGTLGVERGGTGLAPQVSDANRLYGINAAGDNSEFKTVVAGSGVVIDHSAGSISFSFDPVAGGVVTNVGATVPSYMSVAPSAISSAGTFAFDFNVQDQNFVFAAPTGASGAPGFRLLEASDIPDLDAAKIVSGTLDVARIPDLDAAKIVSGTLDVARIPDLDSSKITSGTLVVERGGTGLDGSAAAAGQLLIGTGTGFELNTLTAESGVIITNSAGSISIGFNPSSAGVVTNVGLEAPTSVFSVSGSAVTGAGTLGLSFLAQDVATVFAAPTGASGVPGFRSLIASDITAGTFDVARIPDLDASKIVSGTLDVARIPDLDASKITSGTLGVERGGTGLDASAAADGQLLIGNGTGFSLGALIGGSGVIITNNAGSIGIDFDPLTGGVVTNVGATVPSYMSVSPASISSSGTFAFDFNGQNQNFVFAAPTGASGAPGFRLLEASDIPNLDTSKITTGTLGVERGGTGLDGSAASAGQLLIGTGTGFELNTLTAESGVIITNAAGSISIGFNPSSAGVVTNVGLEAPTSIFTVSGSAVTGAGTLGLSLNAQNQNFVFAAPTGAGGEPGFRLLEPSDIPDLDTSKITTGTLGVERGGTGLAPQVSDANRLYGINAAGDNSEFKTLFAGSGVIISHGAGSIGFSFDPLAGGVVTNVGVTVPSYMSVSPASISSSGTFAFDFASQDAATVFAAPTGASGAPGFRSLIASDITAGTFDVALIPDLDASKIVSGTLDVARIPDLDASKITTGTLAVERGGTGLDGSAATAGQLLIGNGTGFTLNTLTAESGVMITNTAGSISIGFNPSSAGVVTNVGLEAPTSVFSVSGSAVTGAGTLGLSFLAQDVATVFAAPTGSSGVPGFRSLIASDITAGTFDVARIPDLDAAKIVSGTLDVARIPDLDASKITSGTLGVERGGTGLDASGAANGQLLIGNGTGFSLGALIGGSGVVITNNAGSIGIDFDPLTGGVVTNVGVTVPSYMSVTPASISSAGTFAFDFSGQDQNFVFAAPTGASGAPGFRLLEASDIPDLDAAKIVSGTLDVARIPDLDASKITTGTLPVSRGGTGLAPQVSDANRLYGINAAGDNSEFKTVVAGSGVTITHSAGSMAFSFDPNAAGVVTNVGLEAPSSVFTVSGSAVTGAGTLGLSFLAQDTATVFAAPTGASGVPGFRSLIASDITAGTFDVARIPDLDAAKITSGTLAVERGGTGLDGSTAASGQLLIGTGTGFALNTLSAGSGVTITNAAGSISIGFDASDAGVVTNIGLTAPSSVFNVSGSPVAGAGTMEISFASQAAATVFAAPTGASGVPEFRALIASDITAGTFDVARIPDLDASKITTGTLAVQRGGTGLDGSTAGSGQLLIGNGTGGFSLANLTAGTGITISNAAGSINISAPGSGTLGWAQGGNAFGVTGTLGTNDNFPLAFETNNSTRMTITSGGSVGIGTAGPTNTLHVLSSFAGVARIDSTTTGAYLQFSDQTTATMPSVGALGEDLVFSSTGNERVRVKGTTGFVGIGTQAPSGRLHVEGEIIGGPLAAGSGNAGRLQLRELTANGTNGVSLRAPDVLAGNVTLTLPAATGTSGQFLSTDASGNLSWATNPGGTLGWVHGGNAFGMTGTLGTNDNQSLAIETNNVTRMTVTGGGSVGIGTAAPARPLHVVSDDGPMSMIRVSSSATNASAGIEMIGRGAGVDAPPARIYAGWAGDIYVIPATGQPILLKDSTETTRLQVLGAGHVQANGLWATTGGAVGIGTQAPSGSLHVEGGEIIAGPLAAGSGNAGRLQLRELAANGTNGVSLRAPDALAANYTLTLPAATGTSGQFLSTDASGNLSWATNPGGTLGWVHGGNAFGMTGTLGTNDNQALAIETNNVTRMTVTGGGSVGIGTATPGARLDVSGNVRAVQVMVGGSGAFINDPGANGNLTLNPGGTTGVVDTGWGSAFQVNSAAGSAAIRLFGDGTSYFNAGHLGVGTTAPSGRLHVVGGEIIAGPLAAGAGNGGRLQLRELAANGTNGVSLRAPDALAGNVTLTLPAATGASGQFLSTDAAGNLSWATNPGGTLGWVQGGNAFGVTGTLGTNDNQALAIETNNVTRMTIGTTGHVGIGTSAPQTRLHVSSSGSTPAWTNGDAMVVQHSAGAGNTVRLNMIGGNTGGADINFGTEAGAQGGIDYSLQTDKMGFFTNNVERMRVTSVGNVGIGTTAPSGRLHIEGGEAIIGPLAAGTGNAGRLQLRELTANGTNGVSLRAPDALAGNVTLTLPAATGASGQFLATDASGNLSWATNPGGTLGWVQGGNAFGVTGTLGTNDNHALAIRTAGTTRMSITTGGSIGIGTTAPSGLVHIVQSTGGSPNFTSSFVIQDDVAAGNWLQTDFIAGSGGGVWLGFGTRTSRQRGILSYSNDDDSMSFYTNSAQRVLISSQGNMGIGTAAPSGRLHVEGGEIIAGPLAAGSGNSGRLQLRELTANGTNGVSLRAPDVLAGNVTLTLPAATGASGQFLATDAAGNLSWATNPGGTLGWVQGGNSFGVTGTLGTNDNHALAIRTAGTTRMTLTTGGSVGIGTTAPINVMHITQSNASPILEIENTSSSTTRFPGINLTNYGGSTPGHPQFQFYNARGNSTTTSPILAGDALGTIMFHGSNNASGGFAVGASIDAFAEQNFSGTAAGSYLRFETAGLNATTNSERMRITANGLVGIGTAAPSGRLHVDGGEIIAGPVAAGAGNSGRIQLRELAANGTNGVSLRAPDALAGNVTLTLPAATGASGQFLSTDASGNLSWATNPGGTLGWVQGGNAFGVTGTLGTNDAQALAIRTAGTTRMSITAGGSVGIGTTNPGRLLHVNGPMRVTASALPGTPATGDIAVDSSDANKLKYYDGSAWQTCGGSGSSGRTSCPAGFTLIGTSGTAEAFCISSSQETSATWLNATTACYNKSPKARLCSASEWAMACVAGASGPNNMTGHWEWVADLYGNRGQVMGNSGCDSFYFYNVSNSYGSRCCFR